MRRRATGAGLRMFSQPEYTRVPWSVAWNAIRISTVSRSTSASHQKWSERARTTDGWSITTLDGSVWRVPLNDIGTPVRHDITRFDDERLQSLDILRPHITETVAAHPTAVVARHNISVGLTGPFSQVAFLMGVRSA